MLVKIAAAIFTALYLIQVVGLPVIIMRVYDQNMPCRYKRLRRVKPFDCEQCLAAWLGIIFFFLPIEVSIACLCMFGSGWLIKYIK